MGCERLQPCGGNALLLVDDDLKDLLESGVAVIVGTADATLRPHVHPGWGPRLLEDRRTIQLFLETARAAQALSDLAERDRVAVTIADPVSYRSVQFKGRYTGNAPATPEDEIWVQRHRDAFGSSTALIGDSPTAIRNVWMNGTILRIDFEVEAAFDQTPGPHAGRRI